MSGKRAVVVPCDDLAAALESYIADGFRVERISPADEPRVAVVVGHGLRLRLDVDASGSVPRIDAEPEPALVVPPLEATLSISRAGSADNLGRAGMRYRDLIADRAGGRYVASLIRIDEGGPVADYVHYHLVRFQIIYCRTGWVRVVYEGQGEPFLLEAGDCLLQPPTIRHRVLEASPGLEVIEVSSPAIHDTFGELELELPSPELAPDYEWNGQRFTVHRAAGATWTPWREPGWTVRDTGISTASGGVGGVQIARASENAGWSELAQHEDELHFYFVLKGALTLECPNLERLSAGDSAAIPPGLDHRMLEVESGTELLVVELYSHPR